MTDLDPLNLDEMLYGNDAPAGHGPDAFYDEPAPDIVDGETDPSASAANWHMRKIVAIEAQAEVDEIRYKAALAALTERRKATAEKHAKAAEWHKAPLRQWHRRERAAGRLSGKKLILPAGSAQLRASKKITVTDDELLRAHLEGLKDEDGTTAASHVYRRTEEFMISELNRRAKVPNKKGGREPGSIADLLDANGQKVPGVQAVILPDTWTVSGS